MPVNYSIQAEVVDITSDTPKKSDEFLIDTNVWFWITYSRASLSTKPPTSNQSTHYPNYTNTALGAGSKVFRSGLNLAELASRIEKTEWDIYCATNGYIKLKEFRHHHNERLKVFAEILSAYRSVCSMSNPLNITIDDPTTLRALNRIRTEKIDGYDMFFTEVMHVNRVKQIITDDGDFSTVSNIQVFTSNIAVINAARQQGKLLIR